jgi:type IV secretion system protein VirB10
VTDPKSTSVDPVVGAIPGERHVSEVAGAGPRMSQRAGISAIVAGGAILCGIVFLKGEKPQLTPQPAPQLTPRATVNYEAPAASVTPPPASPLPPTLPPAPGPTTTPLSHTPAPKPSRLLIFNAAGHNNTPSGQAAPNPYSTLALPAGLSSTPGALHNADANAFGQANGSGQAGQGGQGSDMQSRLTPTRLTGVSANLLRNQPYLLTMGAVVPCVLQTAMDSTLPGFVTCMIPQDIQGKTGLTLLDRGTKVVGEFKGGVSQGIERMFVVWSRAETPQGVIINLDSPATDTLGRSGMLGEIDSHFWKRFGGALLLTTVQGAIQAGVASASKSGTTTISTGQTESIIAETLRGSINIAPTIRKNQGELVSIFVARDLDFSSVYSVQLTPRANVVERQNSIKPAP